MECWFFHARTESFGSDFRGMMSGNAVGTRQWDLLPEMLLQGALLLMPKD
jgi:hypothetical protein